MTAGNMSTATATDKPEDPPPGAKSVKIRVCVFFDGTLNNRTNINQRLLARSGDDAVNRDQNILTAEERKAAAELENKASSPEDLAKQVEKAKKAYKKHRANSNDEENSYEGFYTNVEKMERHLDDTKGKTPGYQYTFKTYVEGAGSMDKGGDQLPGYAFGASFLVWRAGIPDKVEKGVRNVVQQISEQAGINEKTVIDELAIDVFGFSRGAAAARNFIYEILNDGVGAKHTHSLQTRLRHEFLQAKLVKVRFAGLYDTVSTYGLGTIVDAADNIETLNLDAVADAEVALHLTSADEHRFHFSLTDIRCAGDNGKEYCLPGVHSDIGGGYRDNAFQNLVLRGGDGFTDIILHGNYPTVDEANADRTQLIAEGWANEDELTVTPVLDMEGKVMYAKLEAKRKGKRKGPAVLQKGQEVSDSNQAQKTDSVVYEGIRSSYSLIPLNIMAQKTRNQGIVFKDQFDDDASIPSELTHVMNDLESYASGASKTDAGYWNKSKPAWLKTLRHDYLHFSARMQAGHDPRIKKNKRIRKIYPEIPTEEIREEDLQ